jgi:hypothetical protein
LLIIGISRGLLFLVLVCSLGLLGRLWVIRWSIVRSGVHINAPLGVYVLGVRVFVTHLSNSMVCAWVYSDKWRKYKWWRDSYLLKIIYIN